MRQKIIYILIICFASVLLVACQQTPQNSAVINKNEGVLEEKINREASGTQSFDVPENIDEEVYTKDGKYSVVIKAAVETMALNAYPVYQIMPDNFTQTEVDTAIKYFFNDSPLYAPDYTRSKSMIADMLVQIKSDMQKMDPRDTDDIEGANEAIKKLEKEYDSAPETITRMQITSKLTVPSYADFETLDACVDLGYAELSSISVSNNETFQAMRIALDNSKSFLSSALLDGKRPEGQELTQDEARQGRGSSNRNGHKKYDGSRIIDRHD